jgi:hypothetical protein
LLIRDSQKTKMDNGLAKTISIFLSILLVVSITLAAMKKIDFMYFWIIAGVSAIIAWKVLPYMRKH